MAVAAQTGLYIAIATATSGGTPGGTVATPAGTTLTSATDISAWVTGAEVPYDVAEVSTTNFGGGGYESFVAGLKSGVITLNVNQDFAASAPNALLGVNGSVAAPGGTFFIEVKPSSASRSATNPSFIAKVLHRGWKPFNAKVGDLSTVDLQLRITGGFGEVTS